MKTDYDKLDEYVEYNLTKVDMKPLGLFGERETIAEAESFMNEIISAIPEGVKMPVMTGFYVFWNTLATHYSITRKESK